MLPAEQVIGDAARDNGHPAAVVRSAGALVRTLSVIGVSLVATVTSYMAPLTKMVCEYIEAEGIHVLDAIAL